MDFNYRKPIHFLALLLILSSIIFILILPVIQFLNMIPSAQTSDYQAIEEELGLLLEAMNLIFTLFLAFVFFILFPLLWYLFVNSFSFRKSIAKIRITLENIDIAFLWGVLATILIYIITFISMFILQNFAGTDVADLSNIPDLQNYFSSPAILFILVAIMPIAEEIFFRGFLLEKFESFAGPNIAIVATSILFGIAHMGYGKLFPVIVPIFMGLLLAYIVIRTKNLFASIFAHVSFNVIAIILYFLGKSLV